MVLGVIWGEYAVGARRRAEAESAYWISEYDCDVLGADMRRVQGWVSKRLFRCGVRRRVERQCRRGAVCLGKKTKNVGPWLFVRVA